MSTGPNYTEDMKLPAGKTCSDCTHAARCEAFGFSQAHETSCDFWPNRFKLRVVPGGERAAGGGE